MRAEVAEQEVHPVLVAITALLVVALIMALVGLAAALEHRRYQRRRLERAAHLLANRRSQR